MKPLHFALISVALALLLAIGGYFILGSYFPDQPPEPLYIAVLVNLVVTLGAYYLTYRGMTLDHRPFMTKLLGGTMIKLIVGILSILLVALLFRPVIRVYALSYMLAYFLFTGFEVFALLRKLRSHFSPPSNPKA